MFFKLALRNSRRSRKENGLFFSSLLITIIAFYIILSLPNQDVMLFLKQMESDAVDRLMSMIPLFFGAALVILFFLIYYAGKYQMQRRRHEFGLYLMMGMRRGKLFFLLLAEDLYGSILSLAIGLPAALLLAELISLVTARIAGMGVIGHRFSFSPEAALLTAGAKAVLPGRAGEDGFSVESAGLVHRSGSARRKTGGWAAAVRGCTPAARPHAARFSPRV